MTDREGVDQSKLSIKHVFPDVFYKLKKSGREYNGPCPMCLTGDDRFSMQPDGDNGGTWVCRICSPGYNDIISLYMKLNPGKTFQNTLIELGLEVKPNGSKAPPIDLSRVPEDVVPPQPKPPPVEPSKLVAYDAPPMTMAEDCRRYNVKTDIYTKAGCVEEKAFNRPAIRIPISETLGYWKFLDGKGEDGKQAPYLPMGSPGKNSQQWFRLDEAVKISVERGNIPLILCNGLSSTLTAQLAFKEPAFCWTGGEGNLPTYLLPKLMDLLKKGRQLIVAFDADDAGRKATKKVIDALSEYAHQVTYVDFGGDSGYDLRDYCSKHRFDTSQRLRDLTRNAQVLLPPPKFVSTRQADRQYRAVNSGAAAIAGEIMTIPFASWHAYGGMCKLIQPRKVINIVGGSGTGKTSFAVAWTEFWMKQGFTGIFHGDEWSAAEYQAQRVQRYGGMTADEWLENQVWIQDKQAGVPEGKRRGSPVSRELQERSDRISANLAKWTGRMEYCEVDGTIQAVCADMEVKILDQRRAGVRVGFVVFDYVQILDYALESGDSSRVAGIANYLKRWTRKVNIVSLVLSQANKVDTEKQKKNVILGEESGNYITSNQANLHFTINPVFHERGDGEWVKTDFGIINICKNSSGQSGYLRAKFDTKHLQWVDTPWTDSEFDSAMRDLAFDRAIDL
jgi:hypothetical protein